MSNEVFDRGTDEYVRKAVSRLKSNAALDAAFNADTWVGDPELGETSDGSYQGDISVPYQYRNGDQFPIPIPLPTIGRGAYQEKMARFYNIQSNFLTMVTVDPNKFILSNPLTQNHFKPEFAYYLGVLYDQVINRIGSKDASQRMTISSGFRSLSYNASIAAKSAARNGGTSGVATWSAHSGGIAADIIANEKDRLIILDAAYALNFGALRLYASDGFVHVDISGRNYYHYSPPDKR